MERTGERGTVLVASIVILALLSLLGAGSLLNATVDTQLTTNQAVSKEAFYAAEAGLDAGVGALFREFKGALSALDPNTPPWDDWITPTSPIDGSDYNGYHVEFRVSYGGVYQGGLPAPYSFSTTESGQPLSHQAYTYLVESRATSLSGAGGAEAMSETIQVLETPLVQYYVFFDKDLGWHPGPEMVSWGRIHTNGDLGFANIHANGVTFRNYDDADNQAPCLITASGIIRYAGHLQQNGTWGTRNPTGIYVRVNNLGTIPSASGAASSSNPDYVEIDKTIDASNHVAEEQRFQDANDDYHVRAGVDKMPSASFQTLERGGFYEGVAQDPKPGVDGLVITQDSGLSIRITLDGGPTVDVTDLVHDLEVATGVTASFGTWPAGAQTNADGSMATVTFPALGSIVYGPGDPVATDDGGGGTYTSHRGAGHNPRFPCVLELEDGRENKEVDLLVVDLQRLQYWYRDYLDYANDGALDGDADLTNRSLLIYVSRTNAATQTGSALQAVKVIGSRAGRTRGAVDMQTSPTLLVRTTLATDNPLYVDGDFNAPGHAGGDPSPGGVGCALISDALTVLSNNWGADGAIYDHTGGAHVQPAVSTETAYNAAFFTGRYDYEKFPTTGEEAGIHNFPHFLENWGTTCRITGCLINLWFSQQSLGPHRDGVYYGAPTRRFGWDVQFASSSYWPPYVPSIYSVERTAWRED